MKVSELILKLAKTGPNNEVRLISSCPEDGNGYTENIYLSFDDVGDVLLYDE